MLERVNEHLCPDMPEKMFVTCLYGVLDPVSGLLRFANAGHDLPYVKTADGVVELRARGMPLGLMPGMAYEEKEIVLEPGDSVLLHSDGIVEAHDPDREMFGFPRLMQTVADAPGGQALIDRVLSDLDALHRPGRRAGGRHHDGHPRASPGGATRSRRRPESAGGVRAGERAGNEREAIDRVVDARRRPRARAGPPGAPQDRGRGGDDERDGARQRVPTRPPVAIRVLRARTPCASGSPTAARRANSPNPRHPDLEAKLEGRQRPRGWGLFLIEKMVDETRVTSDDGRQPSSSSCAWEETRMSENELRGGRAQAGRRRRDRPRRRHQRRRGASARRTLRGGDRRRARARSCSNFDRAELHQQHRDRPDRRAAGPGQARAGSTCAPAGSRTTTARSSRSRGWPTS